MTKVTISFTAPVFVVVDLENRTIEQVVVGDEECKRAADDGAIDYHVDGGVGTAGPVTPEDEAAAYAIADAGDVEWPAWEFGW